jgi:TonB-dependent starch-binding outer membrane protein SusC
MNENHKIQCVRRATKNFLNKYVMLAVLLCSFGLAFAQNGKITGKVVSDKDGEALIGVSVKVKGTTLATITDLNGGFAIQAKTGQVITVSYIGYITQDVKVAGDNLNIRLEEDSKSLDEVVVIGYGVQKKKLNTGATVQVKGDDLLKQNTTNALQALQGATPGVSITSTSGQPGKGVNVTIRGAGSINGSNPIFIVDGVQTGDISYLNNADIASIDVLKDAASAAIYGAQASNGVVLVTTRTGSKGSSKVSFDAYYGFQNIAKKIQTLNASQYATIMNEQAINSGNSPLYSTTGKAAFLSNYGETNWLDAITNKNAPTYNYTLGVNGGSETSIYSLSLGVTGQDGIIGNHNNSSYERYNFKLNTEHNLYKNVLKVGQHMTFTYTNTSGINEGSLYSGSPIRSALATSPFLPMYDDAGNYLNNTAGKSMYNGKTWNVWSPGEANPYALMNEKESHSAYQKTIGDIYAELQPIKNLKFKTVFGIEYNSGTERSFLPQYELSSLTYNNISYATQRISKSLQWNWDNTLTYDFKINNDHAFTALLGSSAREYQGEFLYTKNANPIISSYKYAWISLTPSSYTDGVTTMNGGPDEEIMMMSYFGRLNYNYKEKYMLNATFRADGSSHFADGHRWGYFPSISGGWVVSNEDFLVNNKSIDFLKLRLSWGQVGNQNIGAWKYLAKVNTTNTYYYFGNGINSSNLSALGAAVNVGGSYPSLGNLALTWETSEQSNFGVDAKFLKSRLGVNLDLYSKVSKGWLIDASVRPESGGSTVLMNGGNVNNKGIELALTWNDKLNKDFSYYVNGNVSYNHNVVTDVPTASGYIVGNSNEAYNNAAAVYRKAETGFPIGYFWGYKTSGILQNTTDVNNYVASLGGSKSNTLQGRNITAGDVRYVDVNGDHKIDENDKTMIGKPSPDFTFGLSIGFTWKALDFSLTGNGVAGNQIFQSYRDYGNQFNNYTTAILNRWHGEGTSNTLPRVTETNINYQISDIFIHSGDFLRISNVQVGYDFAKDVKLKYLSQFRWYVAVQNAFTFTKYDGMDPEVGYGTADTGSGSTSSTSGIDLGYYPRSRTFLTGFSLKF